MARGTPHAVIGCLFVALLLGCSARRSEPIAGPLVVDSPQLERGRQVFLTRCHQCHPGGDAGLAPSLNDKPLPAFMIRLQVRQGLGATPAFTEQDIGPAELEELIAYLRAVRRHGE